MEMRGCLVGKKAQFPSQSVPPSPSHKTENKAWAQRCCCAPQPKALGGASASWNILERMLLYLSHFFSTLRMMNRVVNLRFCSGQPHLMPGPGLPP